jgi:hypothetical protein
MSEAVNQAPASPVALLRQLDGWLGSSGHDAAHPWRISIAATLRTHDEAQAAGARQAAELLAEITDPHAAALSCTGVRKGLAELACEIIETHLDQAGAMALTIENQLADECNDGNHPPDGAPIVAWRLSQVLSDMLNSTRIQKSVRATLGVEEEHV